MENQVTIGLSVYNAADYIKDCIKSILNQSYKSFELIIVDDGSTDNSMEIVKGFNDKRIKVFSDGLNKGLAKRLNQIAKLATTPYLARMDTDDIMHSERIKKQMMFLENNPDIDVLGTNVYSIDNNNMVKGIRVSTEENMGILDFNFNHYVHPSVMAKTKWFLDNPYDEKVGRSQDYELWYRTKDISNLKIYSEPLLFYRDYGGSYYKKYFKGIKSSFYFAHKWKSFKLFIKAILKVFKSFGYYFFHLFGQEDILIKNRYKALDANQLKTAQQALISSIV